MYLCDFRPMFVRFEAPGTKAMRFRISSVKSFPMSSRVTGTESSQRCIWLLIAAKA